MGGFRGGVWPETWLALMMAGISLALAMPEFHNTQMVKGTIHEIPLAIAGVLGAAATWLGCASALALHGVFGAIFRYILWALGAVFITFVLANGALASQNYGWRAFFAAFVVLIMVALIEPLYSHFKAQRHSPKT